MFKSVLFWKITTLLGLMILMMIPVGMLMDVVQERSGYRQSVVGQVSESTSQPGAAYSWASDRDPVHLPGREEERKRRNQDRDHSLSTLCFARIFGGQWQAQR